MHAKVQFHRCGGTCDTQGIGKPRVAHGEWPSEAIHHHAGVHSGRTLELNNIGTGDEILPDSVAGDAVLLDQDVRQGHSARQMHLI